MGSIVTKYQKCGKNNCKCFTNPSMDSLHGPYFWFVKYIKPRNSLKIGKYKWIYIGKSTDELNNFIKENKDRYNIEYEQ